MIRIIRLTVLREMERKVFGAFIKVRSDIKHLQDWIKHIYENQRLLEDRHHGHVTLTKKDITTLNSWIHYLQSHNNETNRSITSLTHYFNQHASSQKELKERITKVETENKEILKILTELKHSFSVKEEVRRSVRTEPQIRSGTEPIHMPTHTKLERQVMTKLHQNRKPYVIKVILDTLQNEQMTTKELERLIVEEKGLCGRTTFYGYLKELRDTGRMTENKQISKTVLSTSGK